MYQVRIKFEKKDEMRFIGHLDTMRYFQKALRRAKLPLAYTRGFHPHPILSFAQPLGVGVESSGEYFDMTIEEEISCEDILESLNSQMADGFKVTKCVYLPEKAKKGMAVIAAARYRISFKLKTDPPDIEVLREGLKTHYDNAKEIIIIKKTKRSEREIDLKPLIYEAFIEDDGILNIFLAAGSENNIKPQLFTGYFMSNIGFADEDYSLGIRRIDLYMRQNDGFVPLI